MRAKIKSLHEPKSSLKSLTQTSTHTRPEVVRRMTDIRVVHVGMKFVGVDVAKHVLVACALGEDRVIVVWE